jgi:hypothetical protein
MSTPQQPGEGQDAYAQPQDPWAGHFEPGLASVPTDPIPAQGYQTRTSWNDPPTPAAGTQYPERRRPGLGLIVLAVALIVVLGGGGGYAAYRVLTTPAPKTSTPPPATTTTTTQPTLLNLYSVHVNDCLFNAGTNDNPVMQSANCSASKVYHVLRIVTGMAIPHTANGSIDGPTVAASLCTMSDFGAWYTYQVPNKPADDLFFCMTHMSA